MSEEFARKKIIIQDVLTQNLIELQEIKVLSSPTVEQYQLFLPPGVRFSKVMALEEEIAIAIGTHSVRMVKLTNCIAVEVPNQLGGEVSVSQIIASKSFFESNAQIPLVVGTTWDMKVISIDLVDAPHLLVAGASGQGKDLFLKSIRACLDVKSPQAKQVWIDPKAKNTDMYVIMAQLKGLCEEMELRLNRNVKLPFIVVLINEFADLSVCRNTYNTIIRLAQHGRNAGIHLILATQRLSPEVVTGLIKSNFPSRVAFKVSTRTDSLLIIDAPGAEKLLGNGDLLFFQGGQLERIQGVNIE